MELETSWWSTATDMRPSRGFTAMDDTADSLIRKNLNHFGSVCFHWLDAALCFHDWRLKVTFLYFVRR